MFITGIGTAVPPRRYTQLECWDTLVASEYFPHLAPRSRAILKKVLRGNNGITTRHLALDPLTEAFDLNPDSLHRRFEKHAPALASLAAARALQEARISVHDADALIVSTCTGYLCPGLTSYITERLGLRKDVMALDLVGHGCGAALPNLGTAEALIASGRCQTVVSVCVEVCSAAFFLDDDPGVLISACLFGDGAGAAVLTSQPVAGRRAVKWKSAASILNPAQRDLLRFEQKNGMLRNILTPAVPQLAAEHVDSVLQETLCKARVSRPQIRQWIFHAGGREVLNAVREKLGLCAEDMERSARILNEFGNLSSPFVFFVLQSALEENAPGGLWWLSSFGAGFSCHGALLEVGYMGAGEDFQNSERHPSDGRAS